MLARHRDDIDARTHVNMTLANEHENLGEYQGAFGHLVQEKFADRNRVHQSIQHGEELIKILTRAFLELQPTPASDASGEPIFVIGMPPTGATMAGRILSSHLDVHGTM